MQHITARVQLAPRLHSRTDDNKGNKPSTHFEQTAAAAADHDDGAADLAALAKLEDDLCACKDRACAKPIDDKLAAKTKEMDAAYADSPNKNAHCFYDSGHMNLTGDPSPQWICVATEKECESWRADVTAKRKSRSLSLADAL